MARQQKVVADATAQGAQIEDATAGRNAPVAQAKEMRDAFNSEQFNPEQWLAMAKVMKELAATALDRAIETSRA